MAMSAGADDGEPIMDMNTTPLIDVMLVLLVMFIITIPIQTHAVKIDLPVNNPNQTKPPIDPVVNKLGVTAQNVITWNGTPIDQATLRIYLERTSQMSPEPELHMQPDAAAQFDIIDRILADVKYAKVTKIGFVGNQQYESFAKAPEPVKQ